MRPRHPLRGLWVRPSCSRGSGLGFQGRTAPQDAAEMTLPSGRLLPASGLLGLGQLGGGGWRGLPHPRPGARTWDHSGHPRRQGPARAWSPTAPGGGSSGEAQPTLAQTPPAWGLDGGAPSQPQSPQPVPAEPPASSAMAWGLGGPGRAAAPSSTEMSSRGECASLLPLGRGLLGSCSAPEGQPPGLRVSAQGWRVSPRWRCLPISPGRAPGLCPL